MLLKFVGQKKESWQDYLDSCVYAYNTAKHESTKFSPFEVMFFRKGVLPVDFTNARNCSGELHLSNSETADVPSECIENRRVQLETVKKNIIKAQAVQKKQYDRKNHKPEVFVVGSLVLKKISFERSEHMASLIQGGLVLIKSSSLSAGAYMACNL